MCGGQPVKALPEGAARECDHPKPFVNLNSEIGHNLLVQVGWWTDGRVLHCPP